MTRSWMPKIAGILDIVIGGPVVVFALVLLVGGIMTWNAPGGGNIFVLIAIIFAILGIPPIVGGIYALRRKRWQVALIGSLFATLVAMMMYVALVRALFQASGLSGPAAALGAIIGLGMGIVATLFIALSKKEFT